MKVRVRSTEEVQVTAPGFGLSSPDSIPGPLGTNTEASGTQALGPETPAQAPDY